MKPGEVTTPEGTVILNEGLPTTTMTVRNRGDRAVQVGSHYHFFEVNKALDFDRPAALGMRLDIPAGTAVRFEPGSEHEVTLVGYGGTRRVVGFAGLVNGAIDSSVVIAKANASATEQGFERPSPDDDDS